MPPIPPIHVTVVAPEHLWYMQWDFWLSVFTLLLADATLWLVFETRRLRKGSDAAMANMVQHASDTPARSP